MWSYWSSTAKKLFLSNLGFHPSFGWNFLAQSKLLSSPQGFGKQWTVSALQAQKMSQGLTFSIPLLHFLQYNFHSIENKLLYLFYSTFTIPIFSSILTHYFISDYSIQPLFPPIYLFDFCCFIPIFLLLFSICFVFYFDKIFI